MSPNRLIAILLLSSFLFASCENKKDEPAPELRTDKQFIIYDFSATWCGPCHKYEPEFEKLQKKFSRDNIAFRQIDVDKETELVEKFQLEGYPTVVVTADGKLAGKFLGGVHEAQLVKLLKK